MFKDKLMNVEMIKKLLLLPLAGIIRSPMNSKARVNSSRHNPQQAIANRSNYSPFGRSRPITQPLAGFLRQEIVSPWSYISVSRGTYPEAHLFENGCRSVALRNLRG